jgi:thioredoxin reductase
MFDVLIVGGGPAGLNAALVLARARRTVLVCDHGKPRNAAAKHMHGYLTRDGFKPLKLLALGREEALRYDVQFHHGEIVDARSNKRSGFQIISSEGHRFKGRKLLLATGVRDQLPRLEGLADFYGTSVHHCPYCDGYEWRDRPLAAYGHGKAGLGLALALKTWSDDVVICSDGHALSRQRFAPLIKQFGLKIHLRPIARLEGIRGRLQRIVFDDGTSVEREAMFFNTGQRQKSDLAQKLGCEFDRKGGVVVDRRARTCVPGLFLAGDAMKEVQFVICAAAEGAVAAVAINRELQEEEGRVI